MGAEGRNEVKSGALPSFRFVTHDSHSRDNVTLSCSMWAATACCMSWEAGKQTRSINNAQPPPSLSAMSRNVSAETAAAVSPAATARPDVIEQEEEEEGEEGRMLHP